MGFISHILLGISCLILYIVARVQIQRIKLQLLTESLYSKERRELMGARQVLVFVYKICFWVAVYNLVWVVVNAVKEVVYLV